MHVCKANGRMICSLIKYTSVKCKMKKFFSFEPVPDSLDTNGKTEMPSFIFFFNTKDGIFYPRYCLRNPALVTKEFQWMFVFPCLHSIDISWVDWAYKPVTSCIVGSAAIYIMVVKFRNTICPAPPQLSLHRRAALSSNSNGVYIRKNPKSSLYCEMPMSYSLSIYCTVSLKCLNFQKLDFENPNERKFLLVVIATEENTEEWALKTNRTTGSKDHNHLQPFLCTWPLTVRKKLNCIDYLPC
jgi:hypothetical protein